MSIRIRLTLWYVSLLGIVLILFSATFFGVLKYSLTTEVDRTLQERAQQVALGIQAQNSLESILSAGGVTLPELDAFSSRSIFIQIRDAKGQVIKKSSNLLDFTLPLNQVVFASIQQGQPHLKTFHIGDVELRLYSVPIRFGNRLIGMVQVGQPLNQIQMTLQRVLFFLMGGTIAALILAAFLGMFLARITLRPIERITMTANQIVSAQDLGRRLPVAGTNDELDRLSQTMNSMFARLDNFFRAQTRLSADISHELRTPLTIVRGNLDLLGSEMLDEEDRADIIGAARSALDRMSRLVSDLLLLSQADAGLTLKMKTLELDGVILDVYQQAQALSNGVKLKLGRADQAQVYGDEDRLKQLLINLIDNAIKHTPSGGSVTLSIHREGGKVKVSVTDTGEGIKPEDLNHIFDRFYRVKGQKRKGSGLGLAIAKWIAEAHNGDLSAESEPGVGSAFILQLPISN